MSAIRYMAGGDDFPSFTLASGASDAAGGTKTTKFDASPPSNFPSFTLGSDGDSGNEAKGQPIAEEKVTMDLTSIRGDMEKYKQEVAELKAQKEQEEAQKRLEAETK